MMETIRRLKPSCVLNGLTKALYFGDVDGLRNYAQKARKNLYEEVDDYS